MSFCADPFTKGALCSISGHLIALESLSRLDITVKIRVCAL